MREHLEVVTTRSKGRCLVATRLLPKGTEIIVETPFAFVAFNDEYGWEQSYSMSAQERQLSVSKDQKNPASIILAARVHQKLSASREQLEQFLSLSSSHFGEDTNNKIDNVDSDNCMSYTTTTRRNLAFRGLLGPEVKDSVIKEDGLFSRLDSNVFTIQDAEMSPIGRKSHDTQDT